MNKFDYLKLQNLTAIMIAELENISYDNDGGFRAAFLKESFGYFHFHPEFEIVLNLRSNGTRIIGESVELFDNYDMTIISGNIPHCYNYYKQEDHTSEFLGIIVHFRYSAFGDTLLKQHEMREVNELLKEAGRGISFPTEDAKKAEKHFIDMVNKTGIEKMISFFNILKIMQSSDKKVYLCSENYKETNDQCGNKKMNEIFSYINENFFRSITLEDISKIAGMNPSACSRFFKQNSGYGFVEYVNQVRQNKACYLLRETDYHINEIAEECGFASISNFNKMFRKAESVSPGEYRIRYKGY
jgi:AraC-like DNA-binding protein